MKFASKFNQTVNLLFLLTIAAVIFTSYFTFNQVMVEHGKRQQESIIPVYSLMTKELIRPLLVAQYMANDALVIDFLAKDGINQTLLQQYLSRISVKYDILTFIASDKHQFILDSNGKKIDLSNEKAEWYHRLKNADGMIFTDIGNFDQPHLYIDIKLLDLQGSFIGFIGVGIDLTYYRHTFDDYKKRFGYDFILTDSANNIMLSSNELMTTEKHHRKDQTIKIDSLPWYKLHFNNNDTVGSEFDHIIDFTTHDVVITRMPLAELNWSLYVIAPQAQNQKEYWILFTEKSLVFLVVLFVVYALFSFVMGYVKTKLIENAETDQLTQLVNRHHISRTFPKLTEEYASAAFIMADIDHFKSINDQFGHKAGDQVLQMVASTLLHKVRNIDKVIRWGGEEFLIIMPEISLQQASDIAERIRLSIKALSRELQQQQIEHNLSMSFGVAIAPLNKGILEQAIAEADIALYQAKNNGRDQVAVFKTG